MQNESIQIELPQKKNKSHKDDSSTANRLFENPNKIKTPEEGVKKITYFTTGTSNFTFNIDGSSLEPNLKSMTGKGTFVERYREQLENIVFNQEQKLDIGKLLTILLLVEQIDKKQYPIKLKSGKYRTTINTILPVINSFFNENLKTLTAIYKMFNDQPYAPEISN